MLQTAVSENVHFTPAGFAVHKVADVYINSNRNGSDTLSRDLPGDCS
jgi:hypothetical protein